MIRTFKDFLRDERGAMTVDSVIVTSGSVWMAMALISDISVATMGVTDKINERLEYASIVAQLVGEFGPGAETNQGTDEVDCVGNPGNDKCVGNAGETPDGGDDWGSGSNGKSS